MEIEKYDLSQLDKSKVDGDFVKLNCGETHYEMHGDGEAIVLVHGYATPYFIYDKIFNHLVNNGYKVIRYDLLGRGFSERVKGKYTPELFARQLDELTQALIPNEKFYLFGTSMGGSIVTAYAATKPQMVKKIFLLAPAGMEFDAPMHMKMANVPIIGEIMFGTIGAKVLLKNCCAELIYSKGEADYYTEKFAESIKYKGFSDATLSSLRNTILNPKSTVPYYKTVGRLGIPVCTIWGTADKTMPHYQAKQMQEILPNMKLYTLQGSGHIFVFDEGDKTNEIIDKELKEG